MQHDTRGKTAPDSRPGGSLTAGTPRPPSPARARHPRTAHENTPSRAHASSAGQAQGARHTGSDEKSGSDERQHRCAPARPPGIVSHDA